MARKLYITDFDGPVSKNDNAFEISEAFIPEGGKLYTLLKQFDHYACDVEKMTGLGDGRALRYILPFLKAAGVKDQAVKEFSGKHLVVMNGISESLTSIRGKMDVYMVGKSYVHHAEEIAQYLGIDPATVFSTKVSFDDYEMGDREQRMFLGLQGAFLQLPPIVRSESDVIGPEAQFSVDSLRSFLVERLPTLPVNRWVQSVQPMGRGGKAAAVLSVVQRAQVSLADVVYVGDGTTDVDALTLVKDNGGLSISFNGNRHAIMSAEYIVISRETSILEELALIFEKSGKEKIPEGTVNKNAFVTLHKSCEIENVIMLSENTREEVRSAPGGVRAFR